MRLTRGQKIIRNLLLCGLLWGLVYAMLDFPPYTVRGMLGRMERQYFLSDLEPVLVRKESTRYGNQLLDTHFTHLIARSGDVYVSVLYRRNGLTVDHDFRWADDLSRNAHCTAGDGTLYVAGDFAEAVSASVEVTAQRTTRIHDPDTEEYELILGEEKTFTYPGEKANEAVFAFHYRDGDAKSRPWLSEEDTSLESVSYEWYSGYTKGYEGRSILHADLPVKVTLYDADGGVSDTLELSLDNYELHLWY